MATQKALVLTEKFGQLVVDSTIPIPEPGKDELLVKVKAAAINPLDNSIYKFGLDFIQTYPAILGFDFSGEVVSVGEGVTRFKVGDRVFLGGEYVNKYDAFQQYALADAHTTAIIPPNLTFDDAATLAASLITAYIGMFDAVPRGLGLESFLTSGAKYQDQGIFISGASGSVGQQVIQVAKLSGFTYIIASASLKHADYLKSLGATHVIDRSLSPDAFRTELGKIEGLPGIEYAYDVIGEADSSFQLALAALVPGGKVVTVNPMLESSLPDGKVLCKVAALKSVPTSKALYRAFWPETTRLLETKAIVPQRYEVIPGGLAGIPEGLKRIDGGQVSGAKLLVHPDETP